jgi:hypothetical protein
MWSVPDVNHVSGTDHMKLACPARFERATYALEAGKMSRNNSLHNSISLARSGVQSAPRSVMLGGIAWISVGIRRRLSGLMSNLSGKPTFCGASIHLGA